MGEQSGINVPISVVSFTSTFLGDLVKLWTLRGESAFDPTNTIDELVYVLISLLQYAKL